MGVSSQADQEKRERKDEVGITFNGEAEPENWDQLGVAGWRARAVAFDR